MRSNLFICAAFWCLLLLMPALCRADLYIVVNKSNTLESITADQVERIYMLKTRRFENGVNAEPIAQSDGSRARETFNRKVLNRTEQQLRYYWSRRMFSGGERPPLVGLNDSEIETFVADHQGGIGYLTAAPKDENVKTLLVVKD